MPTLTAPELVDFAAAAEAVIDRVQAIVNPLDTARRRREPVPGAWSVDQVLEHLCITNGFYTTLVRRSLDRTGNVPRSESRPWKPTIAGRLLVRFLDPASTRKLRAPSRSKPGPTPRDAVLETFVAGMRELEELMQRADGLDLRGYRIRSPFASFVTMNVGDAFAVTVTHARRHLGQIERTISATA